MRMNMRMKKILLITFVFVLALIATSAFASNTGDVPWNAPLEKLVNVLSGKTALLICCIGVFFAGAMLLFGGDLGTFGKSIMLFVLVGSMIGALMSVASFFITTQGALIG